MLKKYGILADAAQIRAIGEAIAEIGEEAVIAIIEAELGREESEKVQKAADDEEDKKPQGSATGSN